MTTPVLQRFRLPHRALHARPGGANSKVAVPNSPPTPTHTSFQAECVAYTTVDPRLFWLGSQPADSAWLAFGWLSRRAANIADQLDPPTARPVRAWLADTRMHARIVQQLRAGDPYSFMICEGPVRYALTIAPDVAEGEQWAAA